MPLSPGTRLGTYEILAPLGAGGMGEVYRAKDSKLGRDVAIKILPESTAQDAERLARFEREARTLATLNHPNIVTIFAVEEAGGARFLAMELVEGETLDTVIASGGLPLSRFLDITVPLAEALSAAHERGIVHRDLKPGNVMVTREGRVKVLDFGLAKLEAPDSDPNLTNTPTETRADLTGEGQVFGTVAYMSPEQARGGKVDARSDVFSLGVVLYQLLTGERPFQGASAVDMISSILRDTPVSVTNLRADLPPHLTRILRRCLEKDPRDRYQTSRDVYNELKELRAETSTATAATSASSPRSDAGVMARPPSASIGADEGFGVAVLPLKSRGADPGLEALAEGMTEEIVTGLSRFSYLRVISRSSTLRYSGEAADVPSAVKEFGARYVMEGSLRVVGSKLRIAVQLVDARSGTHLWAETYERTFSAEAVFELQDDLVPRIVSTVADMHGVLPRSMSESARSRPPGELSPYEAVLRSFSYFERVSAEELAAARSALELAVRKAPAYADAWAMLALLCAQEYGQGFNLLPDPLGSGAIAARRAVDAGSSNHLAHFSLAQVLFFQKDRQAFRYAAARAAALNPMDGTSIAFLGELLIYSGDSERGLALAGRAKQLNPNHPGWYWYADFYHLYQQRDYPAALAVIKKANLPGHWGENCAIAAVCGQLGEREAAEKAVRKLLELRPDFADVARQEFGKWWDPDYAEHTIDGLRKAGLDLPSAGGSALLATDVNVSSGPGSGATRADEGFWVAVLPFKDSGANAELSSLAEGLTEGIVTGLSRFSYLRVIARSSTSRYANESVDVRTAGKELGARYVMEGNLRQAGAKLRLAVQLVDAVSGAHLWAENYERTFSPEAVFEVQDDLVPRIVSTVADWYGVLPHTMSEAVRGKAADQLSPYEAVLRGFGYYRRVAPEEHAAVRASLESAVQRAPQHADAWVMLSMMYGEEHRFRFNVKPDPLGRALQAARRAVDLAPSNHLAHLALAQALFFRKDVPAFRSAAERAITLNPMDGSTGAYIGHLMAFAGDWERGCDVFDRARKLNPNHPEWYWALPFYDAYRQGDDRRALTFAPKFANSRNTLTHAMHAALYGQLGEIEAARQALQELLLLAPDYALSARDELGKWYEPDLVERMIEGLRKAGLEISPEKGTAAPAPDLARSSAADSGAARAEEGFWVGVLPFKYGGADPSLTALAEGLTGEIVTGLSRFSYLRVIARSSTSRYANEAVDVRSAGKELGARYLMEGTLRQAGAKLRLAVQLVDAVSGAHLWAENYERTFSPEAVFEVQDDLVPRIVSTCADRFGVLARSISDAVRGGRPGQLGPYEALMRGFGYHHRLTPVEHAEAREALERAVERAPANADCWAMLSWIYSHEHAHGFNVRPGSLERALAAARRAVDFAPSNQLAQQALAVVLFFRKETAGCLSAAERAIALNPLDTSNEAMFLITFTGDWDRGCALIRRAMELNPHHPRWYGPVLGINEYRLANYRAVVDEVVKANAPDVFWTNMLLAAAYGQLGELTAARNALRDLLAQKADFSQSAGQLLEKWFDPQLVGNLLEGLRKAGLEIPPETGAAAPAPDLARASAADSGAARADEGFWVAVLPFKHGGGNADLTALADGLSEDIVTGLSRFSYLRVIARSSTSRYADESVDVRTAGKQLGARYVMEGNLRQVGARLRVAVQLVDTTTGAHLWAENYERTFSPEAVFELQDDLVPRIVSTVADSHGVLLHSMSEALRSKSADQLSPYEAVLRSFGYFERVNAEELAAARSALELAVRKAPGYSDAWALLALLCAQEYGQGYSLLADSLADGAIAARRAVEAGPSNHLAHSSLAQVLFLQKEFRAFRNAAARAAALNPMDGATVALMGILLAYAGDWEHGCAVAEGAMRLNPHFPGWYRLATFVNAYRTRDYRAAIDAALRIQMPGYFWTPVFCAAAFGQLGEREAARKAVGEVLAIRPEFGSTAREEFGKWHEPELVEHFIDGLRKAGLDVPALAPAGPEATSAREPGAVSIAVLPFSDMSPAKDQDYFCEGMAEEIMNALVRIDGIRVASRTSAFRARRDGGDLASIARALSVGHVLEGSVRTAGSRLRVTAQLTDVASGYQIWSERFDKEAVDIFAIQDEIAAGVVDAVKARLAPGTRTVQARPRAGNLEAYRSYLKGRHLRGKEHHAEALHAFEEAVRLDPSHAPSWTGLAEITVLAAHMGMIPPRAACAAARKALATARELQGESAEGLHVEAFAAFIERRWDAMETTWRRALELQPDHVLALGSFGISLCARQKLDEALPLFERAREADPLASFPYTLAGWGLLMNGRPQDALRQLEDALTFEKEDATAVSASCIANVALGRFEEGIAAGEQGVALTRQAPFFLGVLAWALATAGRSGEARTVLEELRARPAASPTVVSEAWLLGALGEIDDGFEVLARAETEYQGLLCYTGLPGFDPLRTDPRFAALEQRLELPSALRGAQP